MSRKSKVGKYLPLFVGLSAGVWGTGCGTTSPSFDSLLPAELPGSLAKVFGSPATFDVSVSGPLTAATPGTNQDDLGGVTGCWGAYTPDAYRNDPNDTTRVDLYETVQFDAAGTFQWSLLADYGGTVPGIIIQKGNFSMRDGNRLVFEINSVTGYNPDTQQYDDLANGQTVTGEYLALLSGDQLRIWPVDTGSTVVPDPATGFTLKRFDCGS